MPFKRVFGEVAAFDFSIAGAVFAIVLVTLAYALVRYRGSRRSTASQRTEHPRVEIAYAALVFVVAVVIVTVTARANATDHKWPKPSMTVAVTGFQWCWSFRYEQAGVDVAASCNAGDYPTMVLPVGQTVEITTTSKDVIHSFWVPALRYKMDAFPNHVNTFEITMKAPGEWLGHCAEFCGLNHATMLFHLKAVPPAEFASWLAAQPKSAQ